MLLSKPSISFRPASSLNPATLFPSSGETDESEHDCLQVGQTANIFTDSRYAFRVVLDLGTLWQHRGFITSCGKPIQHATD
eukprot:g24172.t1